MFLLMIKALINKATCNATERIHSAIQPSGVIGRNRFTLQRLAPQERVRDPHPSVRGVGEDGATSIPEHEGNRD